MGLLGLAGAISGAGQALQEGLHTTQTGLIAEQLQKQREDLETQRQERMMQFQTGRDTAAFAHAEKLQTGAQAFTSGENEKNRQADRGNAQTKLGGDVVLDTLRQNAEGARQDKRLDVEKDLKGKELAQRQQEHADTVGLKGKELGLMDRRLTAEETHWKNADTLAKLQYGNSSIGVVTGQDGALYSHMKDGTLKPLINPLTKEAVIGPKGLSDAAKASVGFYEKRIEGLEKIANDPLTAPEQATAVRAQIDDLSKRALGLLGQTEPAAKPYQIANPFPAATGTAAPAKSAGTVAPKEPGTKTVPLPSADQQATMKEALADEPTKAYAETDTIPITKETPAQAKEMLAHRQAPTEPPATATAKGSPTEAPARTEKSLGLLNSAAGAMRPSAPKSIPPAKATAPTSGHPAKQTYSQVLSALPDDKRKMVVSQLEEAVDGLRKGQLTEDQFTGRVLLAWSSVTEDVDAWQAQAKAFAQAFLKEKK